MTAIVVSADLTAQVIKAHEDAQAGMRAAVEHAIRCGQLIAQAKKDIPHGDFGAWVKTLPFSDRTAQGYMQLAREPNPQRVAEMTLREALKLTGPRPAPHKPKAKPTPTLKTKTQQQFAAVASDPELDAPARVAILDSVVEQKPISGADAFHAQLMAVSVIERTAAQLPLADRKRIVAKVMYAMAAGLTEAERKELRFCEEAALQFDFDTKKSDVEVAPAETKKKATTKKDKPKPAELTPARVRELDRRHSKTLTDALG